MIQNVSSTQPHDQGFPCSLPFRAICQATINSTFKSIARRTLGPITSQDGAINATRVANTPATTLRATAHPVRTRSIKAPMRPALTATTTSHISPTRRATITITEIVITPIIAPSMLKRRTILRSLLLHRSQGAAQVQRQSSPTTHSARPQQALCST